MTPQQYRRDCWRAELDRLMESSAYRLASPTQREEMTERLLQRELAQRFDHEDERLFPHSLMVKVVLAIVVFAFVLAAVYFSV